MFIGLLINKQTAMTNEQKLREIAEKWGWFVKATSFDMTQFELNKDTEQFLSDLTALISDGYVSKDKVGYPREFIEWMITAISASTPSMRKSSFVVSVRPQRVTGRTSVPV